MVAFSCTCRLCVRDGASAMPAPPEFLRHSRRRAPDLFPPGRGLVDLDSQLARPVRILFSPCLVLLHIKVNQAIVNLHDQSPS
jgi:hypothetical protein